jgi:hypothetical protein
VSKKTIAFTMPSSRRGPREGPPVVFDGLTGESVPFAPSEQALIAAGSDLKSEEWVRDPVAHHARAISPHPEPPPLRVLAIGASVTINLADDRTLMEAMTLSVMAPFALGWFWWANAIARRQRIWGF